MAKKGELFIPIMLVVFIVLLLAFALLIRTNNKNMNVDFTKKPLQVINTYEKEIQINYYLSELSNQISNNLITTIEQNGGYIKACPFYTDFNTKILYTKWQECPQLNTANDFLTEFKTKIKSYPLNPFMEFLLNRPQTEKEKIILKDAKIEDNLIVTYEPIILNNSMTNLEIEYTFTPETKTKIPDLTIYSKIYDIISINCINKQLSVCTSALEANFQGISTQSKGNLILITYNNINLAIDTTKPLQSKFNQLTS